MCGQTLLPAGQIAVVHIMCTTQHDAHECHRCLHWLLSTAVAAVLAASIIG